MQVLHVASANRMEYRDWMESLAGELEVFCKKEGSMGRWEFI